MNNDYSVISNNPRKPSVDEVCNVNRIINEIYANIEAGNNFKKQSSAQKKMEQEQKKKRSILGVIVVCILIVTGVLYVPVGLTISIALIYANDYGLIGEYPDIVSITITFIIIGIVALIALAIAIPIHLKRKKKKKNISSQ